MFTDDTHVLFAADTCGATTELLTAVKQWPIPLIDQPISDLASRLIACYGLTSLPTLLIPTDVPQISAKQIDLAFQRLISNRQAVIGITLDGGFWCLGLNGVQPVFLETIDFTSPSCAVDISTSLADENVDIFLMPDVLCDIDTLHDCEIVADEWPNLRFSRQYRATRIEKEPKNI
ncbi:DUF2064 domain-containing protein [Nonomuraea sp. NPDC050786]|uniref:DUF2064 domain-containing protein n=1 Tax=Nonomuraea sp. NPDC050786 TaxID=3154840 RepID=UPI0033FFAD6E